MGQRFQFYIQYNDGKTLYASHSGWCYGKYAIQRACQLIDFIQKNIMEVDNYFYGDYVEVCKEKAYASLKCLTEINMRDGSFVATSNLIKEACEMKGVKVTKKPKKGVKLIEETTINPFHQDNNDGIFVLKINSDKTIQYAFDFLEEYSIFVPISAARYFERYQEDDFKTCDWKNEEEAHYFENIEKQIAFISGFDLLSPYELETIFFKKYKLKDCNINDIYVANEETLKIEEDDYMELPF